MDIEREYEMAKTADELHDQAQELRAEAAEFKAKAAVQDDRSFMVIGLAVLISVIACFGAVYILMGWFMDQKMPGQAVTSNMKLQYWIITVMMGLVFALVAGSAMLLIKSLLSKRTVVLKMRQARSLENQEQILRNEERHRAREEYEQAKRDEAASLAKVREAADAAVVRSMENTLKKPAGDSQSVKYPRNKPGGTRG